MVVFSTALSTYCFLIFSKSAMTSLQSGVLSAKRFVSFMDVLSIRGFSAFGSSLWFYEPVVAPTQLALLLFYDGVSSGQRQIGPVDELKADMEGSFETPYDPPSAVDNRQVDMEHRPSGVASADTDLSGCATYYRECVLLRLVHV